MLNTQEIGPGCGHSPRGPPPHERDFSGVTPLPEGRQSGGKVLSWPPAFHPRPELRGAPRGDLSRAFAPAEPRPGPDWGALATDILRAPVEEIFPFSPLRELAVPQRSAPPRAWLSRGLPARLARSPARGRGLQRPPERCSAHCSRAPEDVNEHPDGGIKQRAALRAA